MAYAEISVKSPYILCKKVRRNVCKSNNTKSSYNLCKRKLHRILVKSTEIAYTKCYRKVQIMSVKCTHFIELNVSTILSFSVKSL